MSRNLKTHNHTFKEKRKCLKAYKKFGCVMCVLIPALFVVGILLIVKNK